MKFIASGDLHISNKRPANRKDDYFETVLLKFTELVEATQQLESKLLVIAGDFFEDYGKDQYIVTNAIIDILREAEIKIFAVPGQHDLRYHRSGLDNTPLGSLSNAGLVTILSSYEKYAYKGITFVGAGWEEEPERKADIMVTHRMVTKTKELFTGQEDYVTANQLLHKYRWAKLIISGDNHKPHLISYDGRQNLNCGSMLRKTKDQIHYVPCYWIVDTDSWEIDYFPFSISPQADVFDFSKMEQEEIREEAKKKAEEDIDRFIETLPTEDKDRPKFRNVLQSVVKQTKPNKNVKDIINTVMEKIS